MLMWFCYQDLINFVDLNVISIFIVMMALLHQFIMTCLDLMQNIKILWFVRLVLCILVFSLLWLWYLGLKENTSLLGNFVTCEYIF